MTYQDDFRTPVNKPLDAISFNIIRDNRKYRKTEPARPVNTHLFLLLTEKVKARLTGTDVFTNNFCLSKIDKLELRKKKFSLDLLTSKFDTVTLALLSFDTK